MESVSLLPAANHSVVSDQKSCSCGGAAEGSVARRESAVSTTSVETDDDARGYSGQNESTLSDGRDSGVEADTFVPPDELTGRCIAEAVEYYFSNENLLKDAFLLKHVKRNKEGFVSLKLISSFKHVKHLCRDWRAVAFSIRYSIQLELNEEGTKVRRLQALPEYDETVTSRTIVAINLPMDNPNISTVSQLFGRCGDITSIRVLKPGGNVPVEVRAAFNKRPEIIWECVNCAVIEFDRQDYARVARETMATAIADDDESGMHILPIGKVSNKKKSRQEDAKVIATELESLSMVADVETLKKRRQRRKKPLVPMDSRSSLSGTDGDCSLPGSRRCTPPQGLLLPLISQPPPLLPLPPPGMRLKRLTPPAGVPPPMLASRAGVGFYHCGDIRLTTDGYPHAQPVGLQPYQPGHQPMGMRVKSMSTPHVQPPPNCMVMDARQKKSHSFSGVPQQQIFLSGQDSCPWTQRRKTSFGSGERRGSLSGHNNVLREPKGPDGSRGFGRTRRPSRVSTTIAPTIKEVPGDESTSTNENTSSDLKVSTSTLQLKSLPDISS